MLSLMIFSETTEVYFAGLSFHIFPQCLFYREIVDINLTKHTGFTIVYVPASIILCYKTDMWSYKPAALKICFRCQCLYQLIGNSPPHKSAHFKPAVMYKLFLLLMPTTRPQTYHGNCSLEKYLKCRLQINHNVNLSHTSYVSSKSI